MAITLHGVDGSLTEARWGELHELVTPDAASGLAPSTPSGTRLIRIATGKAVGSGVLFKSDATADVNLNANGAGNPRYDFVVAKIDRAGTGGTGTFAVKQGTAANNPNPPSLTQDSTGIWEIPLALVKVRPGVTQIADTDLIDYRPQFPRSKYQEANVAAGNIGRTSPGVVTADVSVSYPGFRYRLHCAGLGNFAPSSGGGHARIEVTVEDVLVTSGQAPTNNSGDAVAPAAASSPLTMPATVKLRVIPVNMTETMTVSGGRLNVLILPA